MTTQVIIVEDEPIVALDLRRHIEDLGMVVVGVFADAAGAIAASAKSPPDVALMDVRILGGADGLTAAEELYICSRVPVIVVSAYGDEETITRACRAGAYAFVSKPFAPMALRAAISLTLAKHAELRGVARTEELLRAVVEHSGAVTVVTDVARRIAHLNARASRLLGITLPAALDRDLGEILPALDGWGPVSALLTLAPGQALSGEVRVGPRLFSVTATRAAGAPLWVWSLNA